MNKKIIIVIVVLVIMLAVGFWIARRNVEKVEILPEENEVLSEEEKEVYLLSLEEEINNYLLDYYAELGFDGRAYCEHDLLGVEELADSDFVFYYLWALCREYYIDQAGEIQEGYEKSGPIILSARWHEGKIIFISHESFEQDVEEAKNSFPEMYHHRLDDASNIESRLSNSIESHAYYELLPGMGK
jgi:hypothetical protein